MSNMNIIFILEAVVWNYKNTSNEGKRNAPVVKAALPENWDSIPGTHMMACKCQ